MPGPKVVDRAPGDLVSDRTIRTARQAAAVRRAGTQSPAGGHFPTWASRWRVVLCTGSLSNCGRTCLPNVATASSHISMGMDDDSMPKLNWSAPVSAKRWIGSATSSGSPTAMRPALDALVDLLGRLVGNGLGPHGDTGRPGEGVEVPEHQAQVVPAVDVGEAASRARPPSSRHSICVVIITLSLT